MSVKERWKGTKEIKITSEQVISLILPLLKKKKEILFIYLFGSRSSSQDSPSSDVDIAVYTTKSFSWDDYYLLYGDLTKSLHSDRLDLIWLNAAEPILIFEIIKGAKVLYYKDADILNDFELKAKKNFFDYTFYLQRHKRYREGGV